jgi:formylglycine-generating enzyme required for sulfatase activity
LEACVLPLILLFLACTEAPSPPAAAPSPPGPPGPAGPPPGFAALGAAEDLRGSWQPALAADVPAIPAGAACPDADGDGFVAAVACPGGDPATLDCDDADPRVTPATERWVRPGPFLMGSGSSQAGADEDPVHVVTLSGYCLDRTESTNAALSAFFQSTGRAPAGPDRRDLSDQGGVAAGREAHPAEGLTWAEARDFCQSQGKALPTEAQWEKAARGGCEGGSDPARCDADDLRAYPWGSAAPTCERANHQHTGEGMPRLCVSDTLPADSGAAGASPYGQVHLAGNVWEYVADAWHPSAYGGARTDPGGPPAEEGAPRVLRGGSWNTFSTNMRAANRFTDLVMGSAVGVRCARPTVSAVPDGGVAPLVMVAASGTLRRSSGALSGRALYLTAFAAEDVDPQTQMLTPGRSPVAETRLSPGGGETQDFSFSVPMGGRYYIYASLDDGSGADKQDYIAASGSGGMGAAAQNPVTVDGPVSGLTITLERPQGLKPNQGPPGGGAPPPGPPGRPPQPGGPPHAPPAGR